LAVMEFELTASCHSTRPTYLDLNWIKTLIEHKLDLLSSGISLP
jgi:hypothetical protein